MLWIIDWTLNTYGADRERVSCSSGSMGAWGTMTFAFRLGFVWQEVVDESNKWYVTISNELAQDEATVDVTPRRLQKFKPKPGETIAWTDSYGNKGTISADQWGLVTVPQVLIRPGQKTTLTLQRAQPPRT